MTDRIEQSIDLNAPVPRVWRALTDPAAFGAWFGVALTGDFAAGSTASGPLTIRGQCDQVTMSIRIVAVVPMSRFAFAWHPYAVDPAVDYSAEAETLVEFTLIPLAAGTRLTVVESGFAALPPHRRDNAVRMNTRGWATQLDNIAAHVGG